MQTSDFYYNLPEELIAQTPVTPRDHSRLMVVDREIFRQAPDKTKAVEHKYFYNILGYLKKGDLLVWNNSKVFKARLFGKLVSTDGRELFDHKKKIEIFLVREMANEGVWKVLAKPGRHVKPGMKVNFSNDFECEVMVKEPEGAILVQFPYSNEEVRKKANQYGHIPVPPYVKDEPHELESYQTVYARHEGSVAAPTAGFHFTPELIEKLKAKGIEFAEVTLHVGLGTFLPIKSERVEDHTMHSEWVELTAENAEKINQAKKEGRRVIAVGTTTVRTLEGIARFKIEDSRLKIDNGTIDQPCNSDKDYKIERLKDFLCEYKGDINLFIKPGFKFKIVDAMITNFHLPKSTLLMLVSAFAGDRKFMLECYRQAVEEEYRFYSFGDAMLIV